MSNTSVGKWRLTQDIVIWLLIHQFTQDIVICLLMHQLTQDIDLISFRLHNIVSTSRLGAENERVEPHLCKPSGQIDSIPVPSILSQIVSQTIFSDSAICLLAANPVSQNMPAHILTRSTRSKFCPLNKVNRPYGLGI